MVKAIRHWAMAAGVVQEGDSLPGGRMRQAEIAPLGRLLFGEKGYDPYLEDPGTLWIIHWQLASTPARSTTWYWLFNHHPTSEFTVEAVVSGLRRLAAERGWPKLTPVSLKRDVDCCIRTYCATRKSNRTVLEDTLDCPLAELGFIRPAAMHDAFLLTRETRPSLTSPLFAYALADYLQRRTTQGSGVLLDDLMHHPGSPGRVFRLNEEGLVSRVEELERLSSGAISYDETAGLKQIRIKGVLDATQMLKLHYRPSSRRTRKVS
jgi:hypothetical protein